MGEFAMKTSLSILSAGLVFAAVQMPAQTSGTSHPESLNDTITVSAPVSAVQTSQTVAAPAPALHVHEDEGTSAAPAAVIVRQTPAQDPDSDHFAVNDDPNSGVVMEVASTPNEVPMGTLLKVRLNHVISTQSSQRDDHFDALLTAPVERKGVVLLPIGTVLSGKVTDLQSGHHLRRGAAIHLETDSITLPNGSSYKLNAQVVDLTQDHRSHVTSEGTIIGNDPTPGTNAAIGVSTGAGAVTGAVLGGGVGAVVGAGIGAGVSTTIWAKQDTSETLHPGTEIIFYLNQPVMLKIAQ
jgi:hypothetical protein